MHYYQRWKGDPHTIARAGVMSRVFNEGHAATEEFGKTGRFLSGGTSNPRGLLCQWLDRELEAAAVDFVTPCAFHAAVD